MQQPQRTWLHAATISILIAPLVALTAPAAHATYRPHCAATTSGTGTYQTPTQALGYRPVAPARILDTRTTNGVATPCRVAPKSHLNVQVTGRGGVPSTGVAAVTLNLTGTAASATSWIAAYPAGTTFTGTSNVNFGRGSDAAVMVTVPVGQNGKVTLATGGGSFDAIVDVLGYYPSDGSGAKYQAVAAHRVFDQKATARTWHQFSTGHQNPTAIVLNTTLNNSPAAAFASVADQQFATGAPQFSTVNAARGLTRANRSIITGGAQLGAYVSSNSRFIVDVTGTYGYQGHGFYPTHPTRILDTRRGHGKLNAGNTTFQITGKAGVPQGATSVVATMTAVDANRAAYLTFHAADKPRGNTSDLNTDSWDARANLAIIPLSADGKITTYLNTGQSHLLIDVLGYHAPDGTTPNPNTPPAPDNGDDSNTNPEGSTGNLGTQITTGPQNGAVTSDRTPTFTFKAPNTNTFECSLNHSGYQPCPANYTTPTLQPGDHTLAVRATTADGTTDQNFATRHFRVTGNIGEVKPNATNTDVPRGMKLRRHDGNMYITQAGTVIDGLDVHGFIKIKAPNVTIKRSIIRGGTATTNTGLIMNYEPTATNTRVEDVTLLPKNPSPYLDGLKGMNIHANRVNISQTVDGVGLHGNNNTVYNSWIHGTTKYTTGHYPGAQVPSHNDGIQVHGGHNNIFRGNSISGADNAAIQITQDYTTTKNLTIANNWIDNGGCSINIHHKHRGPMYGITARDNRFGRNTRNRDCAIIATGASNLTATNNVWADNNQPIRVRNGG